jgi:hypothetical protein
MDTLLILIAVVALWIFLQVYLLPKLGVNT